jgi:hypothetical protein
MSVSSCTSGLGADAGAGSSAHGVRVSASGSSGTPSGAQQGLQNWGSSGSGANSASGSSGAPKKTVEDILKLYDAAPQQQSGTFTAHAQPHARAYAPTAARAGPAGMVSLQQQLAQQHLQQQHGLVAGAATAAAAGGFRHHSLSAMMPVTPSHQQ